MRKNRSAPTTQTSRSSRRQIRVPPLGVKPRVHNVVQMGVSKKYDLTEVQIQSNRERKVLNEKVWFSRCALHIFNVCLLTF